jgi:hypothetical protein
MTDNSKTSEVFFSFIFGIYEYNLCGFSPEEYSIRIRKFNNIDKATSYKVNSPGAWSISVYEYIDNSVICTNPNSNQTDE